MPGHQFWPDALSASATEAFGDFPSLATHRQVTDAYLLALATRNDGILASWNRGILGIGQRCHDRLELLA